MGDYAGAEQHYANSATTRRTVERRTKALITARQAYAQLRQHHPDQAASTILALAPDLETMSSALLRKQLATIRVTWRPYLSEPAVRQADERLKALTLASTRA